MRNLALPLGILCLTLCSSAFAENQMWVLRLQQEAQAAEESAVRYETSAKSASGMEAFKQEGEAQYFRKLAKVKRDLATAVEKGDREAMRIARASMLEHEQSRTIPSSAPGSPATATAPAPPSAPASPFAAVSPFSNPSKPQPQDQPEVKPDPAPGAEPGLTDDKMREKAEWLSSLAEETLKYAESKKEMSKDWPRKKRRELEKYTDLLEKVAKVQRSLASAYKDKNNVAILKAKAELMELRDELNACNMGYLPELGISH